MKFNLRKTGARRGHYRELWALIAPSEKMFLGHEKSGAYSRGSFLILPPGEVHKGFQVASTSQRIREKIKLLIDSDNEFREILQRLMVKDSSQITVGKEIHVGGIFFLKRVTVMRYFPVPDEEIKKWEADLEVIAKKLELKESGF